MWFYNAKLKLANFKIDNNYVIAKQSSYVFKAAVNKLIFSMFCLFTLHSCTGWFNSIKFIATHLIYLYKTYALKIKIYITRLYLSCRIYVVTIALI